MARHENTTGYELMTLKNRYEDFRRKLSKHHKKLTENDLNLCIMLRAGVATKEMAELLNITPDSVKKAKHRLRKKFDIPPDLLWRDFLISIDDQ